MAKTTTNEQALSGHVRRQALARKPLLGIYGTCVSWEKIITDITDDRRVARPPRKSALP